MIAANYKKIQSDEHVVFLVIYMIYSLVKSVNECHNKNSPLIISKIKIHFNSNTSSFILGLINRPTKTAF